MATTLAAPVQGHEADTLPTHTGDHNSPDEGFWNIVHGFSTKTGFRLVFLWDTDEPVAGVVEWGYSPSALTNEAIPTSSGPDTAQMVFHDIGSNANAAQARINAGDDTVYFQVRDLLTDDVSAVHSFPLGNAWTSDASDGVYETDLVWAIDTQALPALLPADAGLEDVAAGADIFAERVWDMTDGYLRVGNVLVMDTNAFATRVPFGENGQVGGACPPAVDVSPDVGHTQADFYMTSDIPFDSHTWGSGGTSRSVMIDNSCVGVNLGRIGQLVVPWGFDASGDAAAHLGYVATHEFGHYGLGAPDLYDVNGASDCDLPDGAVSDMSVMDNSGGWTGSRWEQTELDRRPSDCPNSASSDATWDRFQLFYGAGRTGGAGAVPEQTKAAIDQSDSNAFLIEGNPDGGALEIYVMDRTPGGSRIQRLGAPVVDPVGEPAIEITQPTGTANVPAGPLTVSGIVDREGDSAPALEVDAGGPYTGSADSPIAVAATVIGGSAPTCAWSGAGAAFADAAACSTTVTYTSATGSPFTISVTATESGWASGTDTAEVTLQASVNHGTLLGVDVAGDTATTGCPAGVTCNLNNVNAARPGLDIREAYVKAVGDDVVFTFKMADVDKLFVDPTGDPAAGSPTGGHILEYRVNAGFQGPTGGTASGGIAHDVAVKRARGSATVTASYDRKVLTPAGSLSGGILSFGTVIGTATADSATDLLTVRFSTVANADHLEPLTRIEVTSMYVIQGSGTNSIVTMDRIDTPATTTWSPAVAPFSVPSDFVGPLQPSAPLTGDQSVAAGSPGTSALYFHAPAGPVTPAGTSGAVTDGRVDSAYVAALGPAAPQYDLPAVYVGHSAGATLAPNPFTGTSQPLAAGTTLGDDDPLTADDIVVKVCMGETTQTAFVPRVLVKVYAGNTLIGQRLNNDLAIPYNVPSCLDVEVTINRLVDDQVPANSAGLGLPLDADGNFALPAAAPLSVKIDADTALGGPVWEFLYDSASYPAGITIPTGEGTQETPEHVELFVDGIRSGGDIVVGPTSSGDPTDGWSGSVDLTGLTGQHVVTATWKDAAGLLLDSDSVTVTIGEDTGSDLVTFTSHPDGATVGTAQQTFAGTVTHGGGGGGDEIAPTAAIGSDQSGDAGSTLTFTATVTGDPAPTCTWAFAANPASASFVGGQTSCAAAQVTAAAAGTATLQLTATNGVGDDAIDTATATWTAVTVSPGQRIGTDVAGDRQPNCGTGAPTGCNLNNANGAYGGLDLRAAYVKDAGDRIRFTVEVDDADKFFVEASPNPAGVGRMNAYVLSVSFEVVSPSFGLVRGTANIDRAAGSSTPTGTLSQVTGVLSSTTPNAGPITIDLENNRLSVDILKSAINGFAQVGSLSAMNAASSITMENGNVDSIITFDLNLGTIEDNTWAPLVAPVPLLSANGPDLGRSGTEHVALYVGSTLAGSDAVSAGGSGDTWTIDGTLAAGANTVTAEWYDAASALLASEAITVNVVGTDPCEGDIGPILSSIQAAPGTTSATVTWSTNEATTRLVRYGTTASYGSTAAPSGTGMSHSVPLSGLAPSMTYHYQVESTDGCSNTSTSPGRTFTTQSVVGPEIEIESPADGATVPATDLAVSGLFDPSASSSSASATVALPEIAATWRDPQQGGNGDYVFVDAPEDGSAVDGSTLLSGRAGNSATDPNCVVDCGGDPIEWGEPTSDHVRPGDTSSFEGSGCTINFLFEFAGRYFFGSAAHCVSNGAGGTSIWQCNSGPWYHSDYSNRNVIIPGLSKPAKVAYMSWKVMGEGGESNGSTCLGNDFSLLEVHPDDYDVIHPAVRMYGGPTGLGVIADMALGDEVHAYGRSNLHDDTFLLDPEQSVANPKHGYHLGRSNGDWSYWVYLLPQGIPGDSGSGLFDAQGLALGAASTISAAGGSNNYANIAKALDYMRTNVGWAPTLVTWDDFDPEPRVDGLPVGDGMMLAPGPEAVFVPGRYDMVPAPQIGVAATEDAPDIGPGQNTLYLHSDLNDAVTWMNTLQDDDAADPTTITYYADTSNPTTLTHTFVLDPELRFQTSFTPGQDVTFALRVGGGCCAIYGEWTAVLRNGDTVVAQASSGDRQFVGYGDLTLVAAPTVGGLDPALGSVELDVTFTGVGTAFMQVGQSGQYSRLVLPIGQVNVPTVTFTVNGEAAGSATILDGDWEHSIDFAAFAADDGVYTIVAEFETAAETVTYVAGCDQVASKVVVAIGDHETCTPYDPASPGAWSVDFADLSDSTGTQVVTATAYDAAGVFLDQDSVTVTIVAGTPPTITITTPLDGSTVPVDATVAGFVDPGDATGGSTEGGATASGRAPFWPPFAVATAGTADETWFAHQDGCGIGQRMDKADTADYADACFQLAIAGETTGALGVFPSANPTLGASTGDVVTATVYVMYDETPASISTVTSVLKAGGVEVGRASAQKVIDPLTWFGFAFVEYEMAFPLLTGYAPGTALTWEVYHEGSARAMMGYEGDAASNLVVAATFSNAPPSVDAGDDQAAYGGRTVSVQGMCTDPDGNLASCLWSKVSGPAVTLENNGEGTATFTAPDVAAATPLVLRLTASDAFGANAYDDATITVNPGFASVEVWVNGQKVVETAIEADDSWTANLDLSGQHGQTVLLQARWLDKQGQQVAFDEVQVDVESLSDGDEDGVTDRNDNCPTTANPDQADIDGDGLGDACDPQDDRDTDGDGVRDVLDNCPTDANAGQEDRDGDGLGDVCDADRDGDGVANGDDRFPDNAAEWADSDGDGVGDNADACAGHDDAPDLDGDGTPDGCDVDRDGDGYSNDQETSQGTNPDDAASKPNNPWTMAECERWTSGANGNAQGPRACRTD